MRKTFYSHSFGCRVNQAEQEELDKRLVEFGFTKDQGDPSFYIINSCSVTHKAEREVKQLMYQIRRKYPQTKLIVTGCAATNWINQQMKLPDGDMLIDNSNKEFIASLIEKESSTKQTAPVPASVTVNDKYLNSKRVILKIQDGCQRFCTYCIVPYLRGTPRSIATQTIVETISAYEKEGIQEVIAAAINTEAYGYDTGESFLGLISAILSETSIPRLSFGSIHPWSITPEFLKWYETEAQNPRFVDFFHIPLQSGSNKILQLMKRGYTREEFLEKLNQIAIIQPFAFIGTDVIVGFLGEEEKDFQDTYKFLEQTPISRFHVFRYSERKNTAASYMKKRVNEPTSAEKIKRARALAELGAKKYQKFLDSHVGQRFATLILEKKEGNSQQGLLENQIPVLVDTTHDRTGEIVPVQILECKNGSLFGRIV
ncbi:MiaB/RimO family radical SAM methylthiotransferase [Candidatus Roizmanbacteria bacterium]|nr:MiaB/RimO family radical SAM methylthiotransferase [Candidatus Roizmanbacteria bacterium]